MEHFVEEKSYIFQYYKVKKYDFHIFHSDLEKFSVYYKKYFFNSIMWKRQIKDVI